MTTDDQGTPPFLTGELVAALGAAITKAAGSLDSLRSTVRRHVRSRRSRGATLAEIEVEIKLLVERAEELAQANGLADAPNGELTAQLLRWSKSFFMSGPQL